MAFAFFAGNESWQLRLARLLLIVYREALSKEYEQSILGYGRMKECKGRKSKYDK